MKYPEESYQALQTCMAYKSGYVISMKTIETVADALALEIDWFERDMLESSVTDTCPRDTFTAALCEHFELPRWPMYCDEDDYKSDFYSKLATVAQKNGWKPHVELDDACPTV